jgi:putative ABC transport system permease protein
VSGLRVLRMMVARSLRQHALSTLVTVFSVALASGLVLSIYQIEAQARAAFGGGASDFDAVLGARGSPLQLVMNTVFHLDTSPGNIPWATYVAVKKDPRVALAVPYAVGDNYKGFRIVGTTPEAFPAAEVGEKGALVGGYGRGFDPNAKEAVIGSFVAQKTKLTIGSTFHPYHSLSQDESARHDDEYTVVGVRAPTNSPADRVVWIPIEGIYRMKGHELRGDGKKYVPKDTEDIPDASKEVSAVLLKFNGEMVGMQMSDTVNKQGKVATLAWPIGQQVMDLFDKLGWIYSVLRTVAHLVCVVAAASILASIYNTINERRREFAILRALGARRATVFSAIVAESAAISLLGALSGFVVYAAVMLGAAWIVREQTGVVVDVFKFHPVLVVAPLGMTALGALCGLVPAFKAYKTDVASNLAPNS